MILLLSSTPLLSPSFTEDQTADSDLEKTNFEKLDESSSQEQQHKIICNEELGSSARLGQESLHKFKATEVLKERIARQRIAGITTGTSTVVTLEGVTNEPVAVNSCTFCVNAAALAAGNTVDAIMLSLLSLRGELRYLRIWPLLEP
jgi:hypothetical protein